MKEFINKIKACNTMPQLDELRLELVVAGKEGGQSVFKQLQDEFRKKKNQLERVPLRNRTW